MADDSLARLAVATIFALAPVVLVSLLVVVAPYGRHTRPGWGPTVPCALGWLLMESPALLVFAASSVSAAAAATPLALTVTGLWLGHYAYRTLLYPALLKDPRRPMPLAIVASGATFNLVNGYANGAWLSRHGGELVRPGWVATVGVTLFVAGFAVHVHSDAVLRALRRRGDESYAIPDRGLHRWVASPNYLGEIVQWSGFALASGSPAGLAFALFTVANLVPRAMANLRWYRRCFPAYPADRRAILPGVL